jgi:WD40 repeat protein
MRGHSRDVISAAFSPDGRRIASSANDGTIRIWEPESADPLVVIAVHDDPAVSIAFAPDCHRLVGVSFKGRIHIWDSTFRP